MHPSRPPSKILNKNSDQHKQMHLHINQSIRLRQVYLGPELGELERHPLAKSSTTPGNQNNLRSCKTSRNGCANNQHLQKVVPTKNIYKWLCQQEHPQMVVPGNKKHPGMIVQIKKHPGMVVPTKNIQEWLCQQKTSRNGCANKKTSRNGCANKKI